MSESFHTLVRRKEVFTNIAFSSNLFSASAQFSSSTLLQLEFIQILRECIVNPLWRKAQIIKRQQVADSQNDVTLSSQETTTWKQIQNVLASQKNWELKNFITFPVSNLFAWFGTTCSPPSFCAQQTFVWAVNYDAGTSKNRKFKQVELWLVWTGDNQKIGYQRWLMSR